METKEKSTLSLCMIVQDEEEVIARALDNIIDVIDEVIVFDSGSTDRTLEIIETYSDRKPIKIFHHPLDGSFAAQRNRCIEQATCDWIFILDGDETCDADLLAALQEGRLVDNEHFDLYCFGRRTRLEGRLTNLFNHDFHARLFRNNGKIHYRGKMHEGLAGFERMQLCHLTINHDKTFAMQKIDDQRNWDMGQVTPPGWHKVDGKWEHYADTPELPHYYYPDKSAWDVKDFRQSLTGFDAAKFRAWYNECMPGEQPPLPKGHIDWSPMESKIGEQITERYRGGSVLDMGCGNGKFICSLVARGITDKATGIDISDIMIEHARGTATNNEVEVEFIATPIEDLPTNRQFDVVVAFEVLEHIFALRDALNHIVKFVKPGGAFMGTVPWMYTCNSPTHLHYFTEKGLKDLLIGSLFKNVHVEKMDLTGEPEYHLIFWAEREG